MTIHRSQERGSALLTAAALTIVLLAVVAGVLYYANQSRFRAITIARSVARVSCTDSGLQIAKAYYGRNYALWNSQFLPNPNIYNALSTARDPALRGPLLVSNPELFADLDGDGQPDVYIYVRDNYDELLPVPNNPLRDNDLNVIVGAMCISSTLLPRREDGRVAPSPMLVEALLSFNPNGNYGSQGYHGTSGSGNLNSEF